MAWLRGLVQSPCGKINVIMTLGEEGVLVHDVLQLQCQQILTLVVIMLEQDTPPAVYSCVKQYVANSVHVATGKQKNC